MDALSNCLAGMLKDLTAAVNEYTRTGTKPPEPVYDGLAEFYRAINSNPDIVNASNSGYDFADGTSLGYENKKNRGGKRTRKSRKPRRKH